MNLLTINGLCCRLGWVAMLVMAIVIIVQTPRCAPKETLEWVQESAMIQYDPHNYVDADNSGDESPDGMKHSDCTTLSPWYNTKKYLFVFIYYSISGDFCWPLSILEARLLLIPPQYARNPK